MKPSNCKYCDSDRHTSLMCYNKPRTSLKPVSNKTKAKTSELKWLWIEQNPPVKGLWECYLRIHPDCPKYVTLEMLNIEHVKSRARHPELKYELSNLKAACRPCNKAKRSLDLEDLVADFPHLQSLIE